MNTTHKDHLQTSLVNNPAQRVSVNFIMAADSYKHSHSKLIDPDIKYMSSYIEPRDKGDYDPEVCFFGLQAYIRGYLSKPISKLDVDYAASRISSHGLPFDRKPWDKIVSKYKGYLPVEIRSLDEGSIVRLGTSLLEIRNTDPDFPWLPAFIETALHRAIWYPTTVATLSREAKKVIYEGLKQTCENPDEEITFKLHDFGGRGVSSGESATLGGMAHLINFMGTDTVEGLEGAYAFYDEPMAGFSIPASEHSTVTCWGQDREYEMFDHFLDTYAKPDALIACVSDSYDIWKAIDAWGDRKERIKESGARLVIRPDSGSPIQDVVVACSDNIWDNFGGTINSKGYKVFDPCVRGIQGDGCSLETIRDVVDELITQDYSVENWAYGMGGGLLQKVNRDDLSFAMKTSAASKDGKTWFDVVKNPITDVGKRSRGGIQATPDMKLRYRNGEVMNETTFAEIRERAKL